MLIQLDQAELQVILHSLTFVKEALIDDAMDDPTADHSDRVPGLDDLITKLQAEIDG